MKKLRAASIIPIRPQLSLRRTKRGKSPSLDESLHRVRSTGARRKNVNFKDRQSSDGRREGGGRGRGEGGGVKSWLSARLRARRGRSTYPFKRDDADAGGRGKGKGN